MTTVNVNQKISKRHQRKVTSSLQRLILSNSTTRNLENIERILMMTTSRINHFPAIRIIHQTTTKRKKTHHQNTVENTMNPQNHHMTRLKRTVRKRRRKKKAVSRRNETKAMKTLPRCNFQDDPSITRKTLRKNSKTLIKKSYRNKVCRMTNCMHICGLELHLY